MLQVANFSVSAHSAEIIKKAAGIHVFVKAKSFQTTDVLLRHETIKRASMTQLFAQ